MIKYLLLSNLLFLVSYLIYWAFLRKQTFFQLNRFLLLGMLCCAAFLPFVSLSLPAGLLTKPDFVYREIPIPQSDLGALQLPDQPATSKPDSSLEIRTNIWPFLSRLLIGLYWLGVVYLSVRLLLQLTNLYHFLRRHPGEKCEGYTLVRSGEEGAPFSFFHYVVLPSQPYTPAMLQHILAHERVHVRHWHSLDILLCELFLIFFWINPLSRHFRRSVELNLEYLADEQVLREGYAKKAYQYHLLAIGLADTSLSLTIPFNQYSIKNRIKMMNLKRSPESAAWRYLLFAPALLAFLFLNGTPAVSPRQVDDERPLYIFFTEDASKSEMIILQDYLMESRNARLVFNELAYNSRGKIQKLGVSVKVPSRGSASFYNEADPDADLGTMSGFILTPESFGTASLDPKQLQELLAGFADVTVMILNGRSHTGKASDLVVSRDELAQYATLAQRDKKSKNDQFRQALAKNNWQHTSGGSTTYREINAEKIGIIKEKLSQKTNITYSLDGLERDAGILELAPDQISEIEIVDEDTSTFDPDTLKVIKTETKTFVKVKRP